MKNKKQICFKLFVFFIMLILIIQPVLSADAATTTNPLLRTMSAFTGENNYQSQFPSTTLGYTFDFGNNNWGDASLSGIKAYDSNTDINIKTEKQKNGDYKVTVTITREKEIKYTTTISKADYNQDDFNVETITIEEFYEDYNLNFKDHTTDMNEIMAKSKEGNEVRDGYGGWNIKITSETNIDEYILNIEKIINLNKQLNEEDTPLTDEQIKNLKKELNRAEEYKELQEKQKKYKEYTAITTGISEAEETAKLYEQFYDKYGNIKIDDETNLDDNGVEDILGKEIYNNVPAELKLKIRSDILEYHYSIENNLAASSGAYFWSTGLFAEMKNNAEKWFEENWGGVFSKSALTANKCNSDLGSDIQTQAAYNLEGTGANIEARRWEVNYYNETSGEVSNKIYYKFMIYVDPTTVVNDKYEDCSMFQIYGKSSSENNPHLIEGLIQGDVYQINVSAGPYDKNDLIVEANTQGENAQLSEICLKFKQGSCKYTCSGQCNIDNDFEDLIKENNMMICSKVNNVDFDNTEEPCENIEEVNSNWLWLLIVNPAINCNAASQGSNPTYNDEESNPTYSSYEVPQI